MRVVYAVVPIASQWIQVLSASGIPDVDELTTCRVPEEDRSSHGHGGNRASSHRVTYAFGDKHHQKDGYALQELFVIILNHL